MSTIIDVKKRIAVQDESIQLTPDVNQINFTGAGVTATNSGNDVTVTVAGGYQTVQDEGTPLTQRSTIDFQGSGVTASDDAINGKTLVTINGIVYWQEAQFTAAPNNLVNANSLTPIAPTTNADAVIRPKGTGALLAQVPDNTATGGNKRGAGAVDLQMSRSVATQVASGANSVVLGQNGLASASNSVAIGLGGLGAGAVAGSSVAIGNWVTASGATSFAFGSRTTASGNNSVAIGSYTYGDTIASGNSSTAINGANTASGYLSCAIGGIGNVASGFASYASGNGSSTFSIAGRNSYAYKVGNPDGSGAVSGSCQKSVFPLGVRTTDASATTLTVGGGAASSSNQVILSNNSSYGFTGTIVGKQSGSTNAVMWTITGLISRGVNAASTTLNFSSVNLVSNAPGWGSPTLTADTINGGLQVQVIGAVATNVQWTAILETTEVIYA